MPRTVRLSEKTEARLKRVALRRGISRSEYIRSAVEERLARDEPQGSSWDLLERFCGIFESADPHLSRRDPGEIIRKKFQRERARHERRSR